KFQEDSDPFAVLAELLACYCSEPVAGVPPFQGGAAGLFGYDLCHHLEKLPRPRFDEFKIPDLAVGFYDWVLAFDHEQDRAWLISTGFPESEPRARYRRAEQRRAEIKRRLHEDWAERQRGQETRAERGETRTERGETRTGQGDPGTPLARS